MDGWMFRRGNLWGTGWTGGVICIHRYLHKPYVRFSLNFTQTSDHMERHLSLLVNFMDTTGNPVWLLCVIASSHIIFSYCIYSKWWISPVLNDQFRYCTTCRYPVWILCKYYLYFSVWTLCQPITVKGYSIKKNRLGGGSSPWPPQKKNDFFTPWIKTGIFLTLSDTKHDFFTSLENVFS